MIRCADLNSLESGPFSNWFGKRRLMGRVCGGLLWRTFSRRQAAMDLRLIPEYLLDTIQKSVQTNIQKRVSSINRHDD